VYKGLRFRVEELRVLILRIKGSGPKLKESRFEGCCASAPCLLCCQSTAQCTMSIQSGTTKVRPESVTITPSMA